MSSPATPAGRRRRCGRGWSSPSKASSRRWEALSAPPPSQQLPLLKGTEVEVRVDDDGFHGSWFEATVEGFLPARGRQTPRYTVKYSHLLADDSGSALVERFPPSLMRPRPPASASASASSAVPLRLHQVVEAFHNDGWWSGIVIATDPLVVAFPITREEIAFPPNLVRRRRDYVDGQWIPSQAVIALQPQREVKVYNVGEEVEIVRDREVYGYSWFPGKVVKVIDKLSYLVEYSMVDRKKSTEYVHCMFIRPAVEHRLRKTEFHLGPGDEVEAYCDGAWSPGVVVRSVADGEYKVRIIGKEKELLLDKVRKLLKPRYQWNCKHWKIVRPKRQGSRHQSLSRKRPSSPVEVASCDDKHRNDAGFSSTKRSRKESTQQEPEAILTKGSEHVPESELDITLSALRSDTNVFIPEKSAEVGFKDLSSTHSLVDSTITPKKRGSTKVSWQLTELSVDIQLEMRGPHTKQDLNRNLDMMNTNEGTDKVMLPLIPLGFKSLCNEKGCLDGGEVDEGPAQLNFWNDGNSQCTTDNTLLRSCLQSGSVGDEDLFPKTSPMWQHAETMEVFRDVRPHFLPLKQYEPGFREGMALGLMFNYGKLVNDIRGSCITDSMSSFEQKITALDCFEENGFDVNFLRHTLSRLIQNKHDHTMRLKHLNELKELLAGKESCVSQIDSLLDDKEKAILDLKEKLEVLRGETEQIAREKSVKDAELSILKQDIHSTQEECSNDKLRFDDVLLGVKETFRLK